MPLIDEASKQEMIIFTNIINGRIWRNISNARIFRCFRKDTSMDNGDDIQLIVEAKAFTFDTSGSSNHNNENNVEESSSIGTENVRNDDGPRFIENSVDNGDISATSPFSLDDNNNNDGNFNNNNDEDDGEDNSLSLYGNNNNNSSASNDNDNSNSNDNGNNNEIHSTPANSTITATKTVIGSLSPMPSQGHQSNPLRSPMTLRRNKAPKLVRHVRLAHDRTTEEIQHHGVGSPTILDENLNRTDIFAIENDNNNNNNNNNEEEEEEEEEEELPSKQLFE